MNMFQHMSLRSKLFVSFMMLLALAGVTGFAGLYFVLQIRNTALNLTNVASPLVESVGALTARLRKTQASLKTSLEDWSDSNQSKVHKNISELRRLTKVELNKIQELSRQLNLQFPTQKVIDIHSTFSKKAELTFNAHIASSHEAKLQSELREKQRDLRSRLNRFDSTLNNFGKKIDQSFSQTTDNQPEAYADMFSHYKMVSQARDHAFTFLNIIDLYTAANKHSELKLLEIYFNKEFTQTNSEIEKLAQQKGAYIPKASVEKLRSDMKSIAFLVKDKNGIFATHQRLLNSRQKVKDINSTLADLDKEYDQSLNRLYELTASLTKFTKNKTQEVVLESIRSILLVLAVSVVVFLLATLFFARSLSRPISQITEKMHRLADGDMDVDISYIDQSNEIGDLARAALAFKENAQERERLEHIQAEQTEKIIQYAKEAGRAQEMKVALDKERELNNLQKQFISMASHELRTPLAIIDVTVQKLLRNSKKGRLNDEMITDIGNKIRGGVQRMTRLIESTLMAAKMEAGKFNIEFENCDINKLIEDTCSIQNEVSATHTVHLQCDNLPEFIVADIGAITQVVTNLLSNATKYSPDSDRVDVNAYREGEHIIIAVRDYGLGIDEEDLKNIGERFFRAKTSTGIVGTGIGLNLVKKIIDEHDGDFKIGSIKGEGSTFTVKLPISGPATEEANDIQPGEPEMFVA